MPAFKRISPQQAQELISTGGQLVDIRDEQSYQMAHIPNSVHLGNHNLQAFVDSTDPEKALIVVCYHGNSSQSAAQYFADQNFSEVYSMDGGFELWRQIYPDQNEST
ncbi:Rhodanese-related sulfurtransferase [Spongiibacter sp. IMCC21906]|jgi:thiosulfate sulfurtransferase|uniref:thiosulfate sulfurtransferase GlpE n=1 Tax=Spongiibacter sp. IMCC21906 TaxID=1620392 RepID=UPI00062DE511|nr:thiosulfate sulfurtransferase GlpE [Spongiibacter sp. IMCC21906]AKH70437.1 Rhodanese-related sulfurtransferase [Spongiibacter sp. IMCC21906]